MNQSEMIGSRLKEERLQQKLTLKQLSEKVGLSIGYLSQVERGYGTLSLSALKKLSSALGLEMSAFFDNHPEDENDKLLVRSWQREELQLSRQFIQYTASFSLPNTKMRGLIFELRLPSTRRNRFTPIPKKKFSMFWRAAVCLPWKEKNICSTPATAYTFLPMHHIPGKIPPHTLPSCLELTVCKAQIKRSRSCI